MGRREIRLMVTPAPDCPAMMLAPGVEYTVDYIDIENNKIHLIEKPNCPQGFDFRDLLQVVKDSNGRKKYLNF